MVVGFCAIPCGKGEAGEAGCVLCCFVLLGSSGKEDEVGERRRILFYPF